MHTFGDAVKNKRASLADELDSGDEDDEDERRHGWKLSQEARRSYFEHEEEAGADKFNDAGEVLEPFNTIDERDGGHFDESMNYVFKKEKGELDSWLADLDEAAMERGIGETAKAMKVNDIHFPSHRYLASPAILLHEVPRLIYFAPNHHYLRS